MKNITNIGLILMILITGCVLFLKQKEIKGRAFSTIVYFAKDRRTILKAFLFAESEAQFKEHFENWYEPEKPNQYYIFEGDSISKLDSLPINKPKIKTVTKNGIEYTRYRYNDPGSFDYVEVFIKDGKIDHMVKHYFAK